MTVLEIISSIPSEMKDQLHKKVPELKISKASFKIEASMAQHVLFKSQYGQSIQSYLIELLKPQKPIHQRRRLPN